MNWRKEGDRYLLRLDVGDGIISTVKSFVSAHMIGSGDLHGIGGIENVVLGYYDLDAREYLKKELEGRYEMLSLVGNVAVIEKEPFVHAHAVVSGPDMIAMGGHLFEATVAVTAELYLWTSKKRVTRSRDERVGLNTLDL